MPSRRDSACCLPDSPSSCLSEDDNPVHLSPSTRAIFDEIVHRLPEIRGFTELVYESISPEEGAAICRSLGESSVVESRNARVDFNSLTGTLWIRVMPTELHDVHQRWLRNAHGNWILNGLINREENHLIDVGVGTRFTGFAGLYTHSSKEPDLYIRPDTIPLPRIVMESGWSESWPRLHADRDLWLSGSTRLVMLLKWSKCCENTVKATAEVWTKDSANVMIVHSYPIFPAPSSPKTDVIQLTKLDVFGDLMVPGQDPSMVLSLDLSILREFAQERMAAMGLTPVSSLTGNV